MASHDVHDVIVVGGGIIGTAIALRLARENLRVALLDRQEPGREASWAAAGILSPAPDTPADIPLVPLSKASLDLYPDFIALVEGLSAAPTGYRTTGTIEVLFSTDAERELAALLAQHRDLGLATEPLRLEEARLREPALSREARAAALLPYEGSVDPRALYKATLAAAKAAGARLFPQTQVTRVLTEAGRCTGVFAGGRKLGAGHVVLAAGAFSEGIAGLPEPVATRPVRGQMVALRSTDARLHGVLRSKRGYILPRNETLPQFVVAGSTLEDAGFTKRVTPRGLGQVFATAQELAPALAGAEIVETWCGLRPDTPDHLPLLGPCGVAGLTIATGTYRNGIVLTPIVSHLVCEWITRGAVEFDWEVFSPLRFAGAKPARQNAAGTAQGRLLG